MSDPLPDTPRVTTDFGNTGSTQFPDTLFGPRDKNYLDFIARQMTRLRGTNLYYYVLNSQTRRMDADRPISTQENISPFARIGRAGGNTVDEAEGLAAMYGEPLTIGQRIDPNKREVSPTWDYADPILVRGIIHTGGRSDTPEDRGSVYKRSAMLDLARVLCDQWGFEPQTGDVIRVPFRICQGIGIDAKQDGYFNVSVVDNNRTKFGADGFYTAYNLQLSWNSIFDPSRKLPDDKFSQNPDPEA